MARVSTQRAYGGDDPVPILRQGARCGTWTAESRWPWETCKESGRTTNGWPGFAGASRVGDFLWFGPLKSIQKLFFHTPLVNLFIFGSEAYHDFYRWPARDRATFDHWRTTTEWGKLFDRYASGAPVFATSDR